MAAKQLTDRQTGWIIALFALLALALSGLSWLGGLMAERFVLSSIRTTASERTLLYKSTLNNAINRLRYLPLVIARHPVIADLLETRKDLAQAREYLSSIKTASNAAVIYVLDGSGKTIASSNWQKNESFEGRNYGFRPYFQEAMAGREGRYFAIGVTTGRAGYFFSRPVMKHQPAGPVLGVVVVKVELEQLQKEWREGGEKVFVTNEDGVIILSSNPDWLYKTVKPLSWAVRQHIAASRTFVGQSLEQLQYEGKHQDFAGTVTMKDISTHVTRSKPDENGLTVYYLAELATARNARWLSMALLLAVSILSLVVFLYLRERKRKQRADKEAREAHHIRRINEQLQAEISTRRHVEQELRNAQEELVLASKMAALGRMSAAIAHEVNQPIAAIRTFAASGRILLQRNKTGEAMLALDDITEMTQRLAIITGDLKLLARNSSEQHSRVDLRVAIDNSLRLFASELSREPMELERKLPAEPVFVEGSLTRIEQVLINLVRNALDAMKDIAGPRRLSVSLLVQQSEAVIRVRDNGIGLSADVAEYLFDPFFTTKPLGEGTGLGLAISYGIVEEMGGRLRARNLQNGGALFSIRLPLARGKDRTPPENRTENKTEKEKEKKNGLATMAEQNSGHNKEHAGMAKRKTSLVESAK